MATGGSKGEIEKLKDERRKNMREIERLKEQVKTLQERLKEHDENCPGKIKTLEEKIDRLEKENQMLGEKIERLQRENLTLNKEFTELKDSYSWLEEDTKTKREKLEKRIENNAQIMKTMKEELKDCNQRIKDFELSDDQIVIAQLCTITEENICRIVLRDHFQEQWNNNTSLMEDHIRLLIKDEREQDAATKRWQVLKSEINWEPYWIMQLNPTKKKRNMKVHPDLTENSIEKAKLSLCAKGEFNDLKVEAVNNLTKILKKTNAKLPPRQTATEPGKHVQETQMTVLELSERMHQHNINDTYASKVSGGSDFRKAPATKY